MDAEIETAWMILEEKLKQSSLEEYGAEQDWIDLYWTIIRAAKEHSYLQTLFPLTSHHCLRFSVDKQLHESWPFFYCIEPSRDLNKGKYVVHTSLETADYVYFEEVDTALEYLIIQMKATLPTKWK